MAQDFGPAGTCIWKKPLSYLPFVRPLARHAARCAAHAPTISPPQSSLKPCIVQLVSIRPMWTTRSASFIRGAGGFGGDRGPSGKRNVPPDRNADREVTYTTREDQALIYRLSGDRNPLHSDPAHPALGFMGVDRPILHGLCTFGFTGRALLHTLCGSDPTRFLSMEGRFSKPVYPGDALTVSMWVDGNEAIFRTSVDGTTVLDNGLCTFRS